MVIKNALFLMNIHESKSICVRAMKIRTQTVSCYEGIPGGKGLTSAEIETF